MATQREIANARKNRLEIIKAGLTRRDLFKMGLLTSAGYLIQKNGLSAWAQSCAAGSCQPGCSPFIPPFLDPLYIPPIVPSRPLTDPAFKLPPQQCPHNTRNPAINRPYEGRGQYDGVLQAGKDCFQYFHRYPPQVYFVQRLRANPNFRITSDTSIPAQTIWGFNRGGSDPAMVPGPTIVTHYQTPFLVRRFNELPPQAQNGGFGVPEVSPHLHNYHSGPESDGGPCRYFFRGQFYDFYHTGQQAGFSTTPFSPTGDVRESLGSLWYHDHRKDHTAENTYKGMAGFQVNFNQFDTGDEGTGFRLPSFPQYDVPLLLADKLVDPGTGLLCFDTFGFDGLVGDVQLVNGKVQPFMDVSARRYRFRVLDTGPSRFYELHLTDPRNPSTRIYFWIIGNDGNLLPKPYLTDSIRMGPAERFDIIIDFGRLQKQFGTSILNFENRLLQTDGRAPKSVLPGGDPQAKVCMQFRIGAAVPDGSLDPMKGGMTFYQLPPTTTVVPRITRTFNFNRKNGQWQINGRGLDNCADIRFTVQRGAPEKWILINTSGGWQHPVHIHTEEFQILSRNGNLPTMGERSRKDVCRLQFSERVELMIRFRDFLGDYPMHCHNVVHEDHNMMVLWQIGTVGDNNTTP
jgi:FtsP/CotA-like multicopper oxidase with cupredoxin domain